MRKIVHRLLGVRSFRTIYPDGQKTIRLCYSEARTMSKIFGGTVTFDPQKASHNR